MEERKFNGDVSLTDYADLIRGAQSNDLNILSKLLEAQKKKENKFVALHKPTSTVITKSGSIYQVMDDGSWKKIKNKT